MRKTEDIQEEMNNFEGKKTTKAYRELKEELIASEENQSLGLGDVVESITKATGIKKVVEVVSEALNVDCGCSERKKAWNEINLDTIKNLFRSKNVVNEISDEDYAFLCDLFNNGMPLEIKKGEQELIHRVYKNVFNVIKAPTSCAPCVKSTVKELYEVYKMNTL